VIHMTDPCNTENLFPASVRHRLFGEEEDDDEQPWRCTPGSALKKASSTLQGVQIKQDVQAVQGGTNTSDRLRAFMKPFLTQSKHSGWDRSSDGLSTASTQDSVAGRDQLVRIVYLFLEPSAPIRGPIRLPSPSALNLEPSATSFRI
jgi:hypothetical protein